MTTARFASVVLDVDSTLCDIEGVDWLARLRGEETARRTAALTDRAMKGEIPIESVYGERLALIRPTREEVERLSVAYERALAPGAAELISDLNTADVRVVLVSGGCRQAISRVALTVGIAEVDLVAVDFHWDKDGAFQGFDADSPLATQSGKLDVVRRLALPRPTLAVGDGATDAAMRSVVDSFVAFTGFQRRDTVVRAANAEARDFTALRLLIFGEN